MVKFTLGKRFMRNGKQYAIVEVLKTKVKAVQRFKGGAISKPISFSKKELN